MEDNLEITKCHPFVSIQELIEAASAGNYVLIKDWIENQTRPCRRDHVGIRNLTRGESIDCRSYIISGETKRCPSPVMANLAGKMLRAAALNGAIAIVDLLRPYAYLNENADELDDWTALHCAVMGIARYNQPMKCAKDRFIANLSQAQDNQLQIIYLLHESGASVTKESSPGMTPFVMALDLCPSVNFTIGAVLLEKLQRIQNKGVPSRVKEIPGPLYEECEQILVQWATLRQYTELVMRILRDFGSNQMLIEKCLSLNANGESLFHVVADNGNGTFMRQLIDVSHISPQEVANWQSRHLLLRKAVELDDQENFQTPVSVAIGKGHVQIIKAIHKANESLLSLFYLNLSNVCIRAVPIEIFTFSTLKILDLCDNKLEDLPLNNDIIDEIKIVELTLSKNRFRSIPDAVFALPMLETLKFTSNKLSAVPASWWRAPNLQRLDLSNNQITAIGIQPVCNIDLLPEDAIMQSASVHMPAASHVEFRLQQRATLHSDSTSSDNPSEKSALTILRLNNNRLKSFPRGLACLTPKLESLHLAGNSITDVCSIEELPPRLRNLDISTNSITSRSVFHVSTPLPCFRTHSQSPSFCNHMAHRSLYNLGSLNCSCNELEEILLFSRDQNLFFPKLFSLNLSSNLFTDLPMELYRFTELRILNISNNPEVVCIPLDIGYISTLLEFEYDDIGDPLIGMLNSFSSIPEKLTYLRSMQQSSEKNCMIKLMIVGPSGHGKSTLLSRLKSKGRVISQPVTYFDRHMSYSANYSLPAMSQPCYSFSREALNSTVGIDIGDFVYDEGILSQKVTFVVWDFAGQEEYFITHHCFIIPGAIYVVCCKVNDLFESGISSLLPWLAMIKAKAPGSPVLIVGTFRDQLPSKDLKRCDELKKYIMTQFSTPGASLLVEIKDVVFVECVTRKRQPCITNLQRKLYELAFTVTVPPGRYEKQGQQKLLHQLVPLAYLEFQKCMIAKAAHIRRHLSEQQPVYSWAQLQLLAFDFIADDKELHCAVEYMKRSGTLVHFDVEGLQNLYFIDPQWLIDKLATVVSTPNISILSNFAGQQHPEIVNTRSLMKCLSDNLVLPSFQKAFCKVLFRFELAIPIDESRLFFPSLLLTHSQYHFFKLCYSFPRKTDLDTVIEELRATHLGGQVTVERSLSAPMNVILQPTGLCYRRFFVLTVVPVSLWPRLISWCLTNSKFPEIIKSNCLSTLPFHPSQDLGRTIVGNSILKWIYWKNGIELRLSGMTLLQITSVDLTGCGANAEGASLHTNIRDIYINNGNQWLQLPMSFTGGIEINVPECILLSVGDSPSQYKISSLVSAQIFAHSIEVLDEIFLEWFTSVNSGCNIQAISRYLLSFTPCPICVGDNDERDLTGNISNDVYDSVHSVHERSLSQSLCQTGSRNNYSTNCSTISRLSTSKQSKKSFFDYEQPEVIAQVNRCGFRYVDSADTIGRNPVGFTMMHCLWMAQYQDFVNCPKHGKLEMKYLTPDLVYADAKDFIISKTRLTPVSDKAIKKGGFGRVLKQRLIDERDQSIKDVAIKVLANCDVHSPEIILQQYCDIRRELNMIYGLKHERVVKFFGIIVHPVGFVMEWAGMGSLDDIINQYHSQRHYICPDAVFAVTLQVINGLEYLHKNRIVHFDIKPQNVLIFKFPRESHCCYSQSYGQEVVSQRCIHCSKTRELDGVRTKIADLGISVRKGPRGFVRKIATPGHTAPEALLHCGLEQLSEKVDMFSLGMCMYETMSCTLVPPKEYSNFEFDDELKTGIRPGFLENDPRYPALLYDCMTSCWDQDPEIRPSAKQLFNALSFPKLQLIDNFVFSNYKIADIQCCCKVFTEENGKEFLWFGISEQSGGSSILVVEFQVHGNKVVPKATSPICFTENVLKICQVQKLVYVILSGIKIAIVHSQTFELLTVDQNPFNTAVTASLCAVSYIQEVNVLLLAFTSGDIGVLSLPHNQFNLTSFHPFEYDVISSIEKKDGHLCCLGVKGHFLCMEIVIVDDIKELWCGSTSNNIYILSLQSLLAEATPVVSRTIENVSGFVHTFCKILQLKMIDTLSLQLICVLLDDETIVFYDAALKHCLKRTRASEAIVMLPCNSKLYLGTRSGKILSLNINSVITDEATSEKPMVCGEHTVGQPVCDLLTVTGELSPHSFLEGFGSVDCRPSNKPCKVMLSIGGGYTEFFSCSGSAITFTPSDLCIISFRV